MHAWLTGTSAPLLHNPALPYFCLPLACPFKTFGEAAIPPTELDLDAAAVAVTAAHPELGKCAVRCLICLRTVCRQCALQTSDLLNLAPMSSTAITVAVSFYRMYLIPLHLGEEKKKNEEKGPPPPLNTRLFCERRDPFLPTDHYGNRPGPRAGCSATACQIHPGRNTLTPERSANCGWAISARADCRAERLVASRA